MQCARLIHALAVLLSALIATTWAPPARAADPAADLAGLGIPASSVRLVQEIDSSQPNKDLLFIEFPPGVSRVQPILGVPCRTLPADGDARYFAYRLGEGKGLKAGGCYLLSIDYPEDLSRTLYICNWGCETAAGFATGESLGDVCKGKYVPNNPESLKYPLSGKFQKWTQLFYLHDRFPEIKRPRGLGPRPLTPADGFWLIIAQPAAFQDPRGAGAAISTIRLYEVTDPSAAVLKPNLPPQGLPRRHIFSREEMADGVVAMGHKPEEKDDKLRGVRTIADWYEHKMRVMQFLGVDTYAKDLLEFGHNQGWDSADGGGNNWIYQSSTPELWAEIVDRAARRGLCILPYYEYRGSIGGAQSLGPQRRCKRLDGGDTYTHIAWCEKANADVTDPDTLADARKLLDVSLLKYKDKARFLGAWFRHRPTALPISFNDNNLRLFAAQANDGNRIARSHLQGDRKLLDRYYQWWFGQRRQFLQGLRDHLRQNLAPDAFILYTNDNSEPGQALPRSITGQGKKDGWQWMQVVVNQDVDAWATILSNQARYGWMKPYDFREVVDQDMHLRGLQAFGEYWGKWEMAHACPPDDPATYKDADGLMLSYTYNRIYTVSSPRPFDAYRSKSGLAIMRHYALNENEMTVGRDDILGYFVCDVERAGPYCMMAEARAMAHGNPYYLGSLTGNTPNRGFPAHVRRFHAAFLALPALPGEVLPNASSDAEVIVRAIPTPGHGTYLAVVNTGFSPRKNVRLTLPAAGAVHDAATEQVVSPGGKEVTLSLDPAELRALRFE